MSHLYLNKDEGKKWAFPVRPVSFVEHIFIELILCAMIHDRRDDTMLRKTEIDSSCSLIKGKGHIILNQKFFKNRTNIKPQKYLCWCLLISSWKVNNLKIFILLNIFKSYILYSYVTFLDSEFNTLWYWSVFNICFWQIS